MIRLKASLVEAKMKFQSFPFSLTPSSSRLIPTLRSPPLRERREKRGREERREEREERERREKRERGERREETLGKNDP